MVQPAGKPGGSRRRSYLLAAGPILGALIGVLTNVITSAWNWWIFGALIILVTCATIIVVSVEGGGPDHTDSRRAAESAAKVDLIRGMPFQLPPVVANFSGRTAEIATLLRVLDRHRKGPTGMAVVALSGKAGVGKTALAVQLAHQLAPLYPDGQLYVDLRGVGPQPVDATEALAGFLRALGVDSDAIPATLEDRSILFRSISATRRLLIVLDNAASAIQVRPLLPAGEGCAVIVTSRPPMGDLESSESLAVEVLPTTDAVQLLTSVLGTARTADEPEAVQEIARLCGCLPLALRVASGRLLMRRHWKLSDMVELLRDDHRRLNELRVGDLEVRASFSVSYEAQDQRHQRAFRLLGLLNFVDLPGWTAAAVLDEDATEGAEVLERLCEAQLIEIAGRTKSGEIRYRFHDLIRDFTRDSAIQRDEPEVRRAALSRVLGGYLNLAEQADAMLEPGLRNIDSGPAPRWPADDPDFAERELAGDPQGWFAVNRSNLVSGVEHAAENGLHALTWELAGFFAAFFAVRIYPRDWERTHQLAIEACAASGDQRGLAFSQRSLGRLYRYQGRWDLARDNYLQALEIFRRFGDRQWQGIVFRNLGDLECDTGNFEAAERQFSSALDIFQDMDDQQWLAATLIGLGHTYIAEGRPREAVDCFLRCLPIFEAGGNVWWWAVALVEVGNAYASLSRRAEAERYLDNGLRVFLELGDDRRTALTQLSLGQLWAGNDVKKSLAVLDECLKTFRAAEDRLCVARALDAMAHAYAAGGKRRKARALREESARMLDNLPAAVAQANQRLEKA